MGFFSDSERMHVTDPKAYIDLVKELKSGSYDTTQPSGTDSIEPDMWAKRFKTFAWKIYHSYKK